MEKLLYLKEKLNRKDYITAGAFGALSAVVSVAIGFAFAQALGPGMAIINSLVTAIIIAVGVLSIRKFGAGFMIMLVTSILVIPTPQLGPPGPQKIIMGIILGLSLDIVLYAFRRNLRWGIVIAVAVMDFLYVWILLLVLTIFHLPAEKFIALAPKLAIAGLLIGVIAGLISYELWKRLRRQQRQ